MSLRAILRDIIASKANCSGCAFFRNDFAAVEKALPGLSSFSSSRASVRANDGVCERHAALINGRRRCSAFARAG